MTTTGSPPTSPTPPPARLAVSVNGERREVPGGTTLADVVATLATSPAGVAAALNETVVPRGQWPATALREGDRVEVLTAVQGG